MEMHRGNVDDKGLKPPQQRCLIYASCEQARALQADELVRSSRE